MSIQIKKLYFLAILLLTMSVNLKSQDTLIFPGASWKYLDDGSNQGTAWTGISFNDAGWSSGPAELGYGDGDESTVISYGGNSSNKHITYYFRKRFNVSNPASVQALELHLIRDDGAVVYLNGTEVYRTNMPSGTISYTTTASSAIGGSSESTWLVTSIDKSLLTTGNNVLSVEVHQANATSSDLSFHAFLVSTTPSVSRGPYLQMVGPDRMTVRWRTNVATETALKYGTTVGNQNITVTDTNSTTEHEVVLTGLTPNTQYYYSVGYGSTWLKGENSNYSLKTAPPVGTNSAYRFWVLGDAGTATQDQRDVRDAYYNYTSGTYTDAVLFLGDNAYNNGTDAQYQSAVFEIYDSMMAKSASFSCPGNHEFYNGNTFSSSQTGPYYDIFTFPTAGELGGLASGTEAYYSFDYGNIHFISMDSHDSPRTTSGPMLTWLRNDLAANTLEWVIVFFHHPPYTKGSHDSDSETQLIEMRENALPILEDYGVDLVLSGHSHSYERSYLVNGHYGNSSTFNASTMGIDMGSGNPNTDCAYRKETVGANAGKGAVYITAGSSGKKSGGALNHNVMRVSLNELGSVIVDVDSNQLDVRFIDEIGGIQDYFSIIKDESIQMDTTILSGQSVTLTASWTGSYSWSNGATSQSITVSPGSNTVYTVENPSSCQRDFFAVNVSTGNKKPVAVDDVVAASENTPIDIDIVANDLDPESALDYSTLTIISGPAHGSASVNTTTGILTYTPSNNYLGEDKIVYTISDDGMPAPVKKDTATVYINVNVLPLALGTDSVKGLVFMDANLNGTFDSEDYGAGAVGVNIYKDLDNSGTVSAGDVLQKTVTTLTNGTFETTVDAPGVSQMTYQVNSSSDDAVEDASGSMDLTSTELFVGNKPDGLGATNGSFITAGSTWKYLDDGSNQGTAWQAISFNDASWASGNAQLGYGDGDETTVISYGSSSSNKHITYYFRQSFNVSDPSAFSSLELQLLRDDGAVVYLNGTEVYRSNMPSGTISYTTQASSAVGGSAEDAWHTTTVSPSLLVTGNNVLAVEVHQRNSTSSDLSFDCSLTGTAASSSTNLIASGDSWDYLDDGSNQGKDWRAPNFDASTWSNGVTQFGYGGNGENTTISYGSNSSNKHITYYFRKEISVANPSSYDFLKLQLIRDDGAVVYINGVEVARSNLPDGNIDYTRLANMPISGADESTYHTFYVNADVLVPGTNTVAVEMHQVNATSSDLSFDLILDAVGSTQQTVGLRFNNIAIAQGAQVDDARFKWIASDSVPAGSQFIIEIEANDNASAFSSSNNDISGRTMVADSLIWYFPEYAPAGDTITGPSMVDLVQAVINRPGWTSGNSLVFRITGSGLRRIYSYDQSAANAPMLDLTYNDGSGAMVQYIIEVDTNDLPAGYRFATDNVEIASFTASNQTNSNNNIGYIGSSTTCYAVGDGENTVASDVTFHIVNRRSGRNIKIGNANAESIESIAWNETGDTLFAMSNATLGFININTGEFIAIGSSSSQANGTYGNLNVDDIDGLSFDHVSNRLYGTLRRTSGNNDVLLQFNRNTGAFIPGAFGGNDYVPITGTGIVHDIDDIAFNPLTGTLYAINNDDASVNQLINVNKSTGVATVIGNIGANDMEGQGFSSDGTYYGTTGNDSDPASQANAFWQIDINTGDTTRIGNFSDGIDFESCDCITNNPKNLLYGTIFNDLDSNSVMNGSDTGYAGVKVYLYHDMNSDGVINAGDVLMDSMLTNANGDYSFLTDSAGDFLTSISLSTLPSGASLTTDNLEDAGFNTFGQTDPNNNFGFNLNGGTILPLDLISFEVHAEDKSAVLEWISENEEGLQAFEVERSSDGKNFKKIGSVAAFNTDQAHEYQFTDEESNYGLNYYRLKMMDFDGRYEYSIIRTADFSRLISHLDITLYPNPVVRDLTMKIQSEDNSMIEVTLCDMTGRTLWSLPLTLSAGQNLVKVAMSDRSSGTYILKIRSERGFIQVFNLMKIK